MGEVRFMISEAAKQVDVEPHVLRYWEEELGLVIGRTEMGHRYYTKEDIRLFCCIKKLKDEGMLLKELKPLIPEIREVRLKIKQSGENDREEHGVEKSVPVCTETETESGEIMIPFERIEQVRTVVGDVFREALEENNAVLKKDISSTVTADVVEGMDFLLQAKERRQEEYFRRLDTLIRQQQNIRKEAAKGGAIFRLKRLFT